MIASAAKQAAAVAFPGAFVPLIDQAGTAAIWGKLIIDIGATMDHPLDLKYATKFALSAMAGAAGYNLGSKIFGYILMVTGVAVPFVVGTNAFLNWWFTLRFGKEVVKLFQQEKFDLSKNVAFTVAKEIFVPPFVAEIKEFIGLNETANA